MEHRGLYVHEQPMDTKQNDTSKLRFFGIILQSAGGIQSVHTDLLKIQWVLGPELYRLEECILY